MTRYEVMARAGDTEVSLPLVVTDTSGGLFGAQVYRDDGGDVAAEITELEELTRRPLVVRRHEYGPVIPVDVHGSDTAADTGKARKSVLAFMPGKGCTPAALDVFLTSCQAAGIVADVQIWPQAHRYMPPARFKVLCELYVPVIHDHGYTHTFVTTNFGAVMDDALTLYWPGRELADRIGIVFYPSGLTLDLAARFADDKGVPLGLAEFGADPGGEQFRDAKRFLEYVHDFFAARKASGKPCGDLIWFHGARDGDFRVSRAWEFPLMYRRMYDDLMT